MSASASDSSDFDPKYLVPALARGLTLLAQFNHQDRRLSAPELARRLQLPRSTVFRLLSTLEAMGYVEKEPGGYEYKLGLAVLRLGFDYLASLELTELGAPILDRLRDAIGLSCNLVVRDGRSIVYVAKSASPTPFTSSVKVGTRLPAHATVLGRILLEDLDLEALRALFPEQRLAAFSPSTPETVEALYALIQQDKEKDYVVQESFYEANMFTIAAAVRDGSGQVVAALGATGPSSRFEAEALDDWVDAVRRAAVELSGLLNYSPARSRIEQPA